MVSGIWFVSYFFLAWPAPHAIVRNGACASKAEIRTSVSPFALLSDRSLNTAQTRMVERQYSSLHKMRLATITLFLVTLCQNSMSDAVTYNEPRKDQSNILLSALTGLQALKSYSQLNSHFSEPETAYYLKDASFLGRTKTAQGFKNLIRVTFIRSSSYSEECASTPPPRGHSFVVIFGDDLTPEHFISIPMPDRAILQNTVLTVDGSLYQLSSEATFKAFTQIKSEQNRGGQAPTRPESK